jgi:hypothetical protein
VVLTCGGINMKNPNISIGFSVSMCKDCNKQKIGTKIYEYFEPSMDGMDPMIIYRDGICYINEQTLMSVIRMVNPHQKDRKIQVVSQEEFRERKARRVVETCKEQ